MENYQKIISSFLSGSVENIKEKKLKPEHLETQISHLFLFPETVYKICKRDNQFFNKHFRDLQDHQKRVEFYKSDFSENNYFSPDVYLNLYGINVLGNTVSISSDIENSQDIIMRMRRIDLKNNLSNLLQEKKLQEKDFRSMGYQQTKEVALYPERPKTEKSYDMIFLEKLEDNKNWMGSALNYWKKEEINRITEKMIKYVRKNKNFFANYKSKGLVVALDNHSDNIFYENGKMFFLDIYPPKEDWKIGTPDLNIYRPATDILILLGEKYARAFIQGYKDYYGDLDENYELFYFLYSAVIQSVSLYNLSENNPIKKQNSIIYKDYILENIGKLKEYS